MKKTENITGYIRKLIIKKIFLSEKFIQAAIPLGTNKFNYDHVDTFFKRCFVVPYQPYQFAYLTAKTEPMPVITQKKQFKKIIYHPPGLYNFKQKKYINDFESVQQSAKTNFVHTLDLIDQDWKMDEFELDDVKTVASEYDCGDRDDEFFEEYQLSMTQSSQYSNSTKKQIFQQQSTKQQQQQKQQQYSGYSSDYDSGVMESKSAVF